MRYWNGHSWREHVQRPLSVESIEEAVIETLGLDRLQMSQLEQHDYEQKLSGVTIARAEAGELDDPVEVIAREMKNVGDEWDYACHQCGQVRCGCNAAQVVYDEEDHAKGLPDE